MSTKGPVAAKTAKPKPRTGFLAAKPTSRPQLPSVRVIKKYPNRRLYDTHTSTYITLPAVKTLVMGSTPFVVLDVKTNEDLTRSILLQIILEEEAGGTPLFTESVLATLIRFYGNAMQNVMGTYLEKNLDSFVALQRQMNEQSKNIGPELWAQHMQTQSPVMQSMVSGYIEQSQTLLKQMQEKMFNAFGVKL